MTSTERVTAAFSFQQPDRIPRYDGFWGYTKEWEARFGHQAALTDMLEWVPLEGTFPTRMRQVKEEGGWIYEIDQWGRLIRRQVGSYFAETLEVPMPPGTDPDTVTFDPPELDLRYLKAASELETVHALDAAKEKYFVVGKTGGPYLRTTFIRGEAEFLMDIAGDPDFARVLADKMADHLIGIAREQIRRWSLYDTGVFINDDMAYNDGPMFSPESFEKVFLPAYRRMVREYKAAGAKWVLFHSDGNIMPVLDMLVDAGIDGINPIERRAGMDPMAIRRRWPHLILIGGVCNTDILLNGPVARIEAHVRELIDLGRHGGLVIGTHSINPAEIPPAHFEAYHRTCMTYGNFRT
ncbi:MAG: hypothetical protein A3K19_15865 [Lentisphaerae bacterium RIFOXYB12_FULL_65_16]|nr:MAG: hypothetical protein A3K18_03285 [Lentisphaerae bacterium RIFOXYA12_64_32]OGV87358.1 MAG: hypothetical protein A3K19_15865 [Lentisphaerae bacterium RIFOXYB12_FULL_65_16]